MFFPLRCLTTGFQNQEVGNMPAGAGRLHAILLAAFQNYQWEAGEGEEQVLFPFLPGNLNDSLH